TVPVDRATPRKLKKPDHTTGRDLREQFQPLARHCRFLRDEAGDVSSGSRQALYEALFDRLTDQHKHDRNRLCLALQCSGLRTIASEASPQTDKWYRIPCT